MEKESVPAESIARLADKKQDVSSYFTNDGKMMPPLVREIDLGEETIERIEQCGYGTRNGFITVMPS